MKKNLRSLDITFLGAIAPSEKEITYLSSSQRALPGNTYWLRTTTSIDALKVDSIGEIEVAAPEYGGGIRPMLVVEYDEQIEEEYEFKAGDIIKLDNDLEFTCINKNVLLGNFLIGYASFCDYPQISPYYEDSFIKPMIDEWFEDNFL